MLIALNQTVNGYYMMDYFTQKLIVSSPSAPILCGYPKEMAREEKFNFFTRIMNKTEWTWLNRVNEAAYEVFFKCSSDERKYLCLSYDLELTTIKNKKIILTHKVVPYKLCRNGNLWLGLCYVTLSSRKESGHPTIVNTLSGIQYEFDKNRFYKQDKLALTNDELMILEWLIKGLSDKQICELLNNMSISNFKRRKRMLFQKLDVGTSAGAVHKAHLIGII